VLKCDKRIRLSIYFIIAALLVTGTIAFGAEEPLIRYSKTSLRPGDFLQVQLTSLAKPAVTVRFLGQTKNLYPDEAPGFWGIHHWMDHVKKRFKKAETTDYRCLLAVPLQTQPGKYPLMLEYQSEHGGMVREQMIEVTNRAFSKQRIVVPEKLVEETLATAKRAQDEAIQGDILKKAYHQKVPCLWRGRFVEPVTGRKTTDFGVLRFVNDIENGPHSGWDLAVVTGTGVGAINKGRVVFAGNLNVTGKTVILHHGLDLFSLYAHLSRISVKEGEIVAKGDIIGKVGSTGLSTGPHLHLTLKVGDIPVDPDLVLWRKIGWNW